jgi:hypothetical protein
LATELALEQLTEKTRQTPIKFSEFYVGEKVLYKAEFNNPGNYAPDEMLSGTVINKFWNYDTWTYRIELDHVWQRILDGRLGQKIVVGNIHGARMRLHT